MDLLSFCDILRDWNSSIFTSSIEPNESADTDFTLRYFIFLVYSIAASENDLGGTENQLRYSIAFSAIPLARLGYPIYILGYGINFYYNFKNRYGKPRS